MAGRAIKQKQEDRERRAREVGEVRKGSCARFLGWAKNLVGGVLGDGQGQRLSVKEGAVREPLLTCRIDKDWEDWEKGFPCEMSTLGKTQPTENVSSL